MPFYINCAFCGKRFARGHGNQKLCSYKCKVNARAKISRKGMRGLRLLKLNGQLKDKSCQVCGYAETIDLHHEGGNKYILCPNHHALISRGIKRIEDYNIQPVILADSKNHKFWM